MLAPLARKLLPFFVVALFFLVISHFPCRFIDRPEGGSEEEEPATHDAAPTSTSNTLVISEERRTAAETSPPPEQNTETSTPTPSPQAPLPKKVKIGAGKTREITTGDASSALMDDVSYPSPLFCLSIFPLLPMLVHPCRVFFP
jgi:hypothetical protein